MRLIDVEKLVIETQSLEELGQSEMEFYSVEQIADAPTVDAQPVIHAKWIRHYAKFGEGGDHWKCSECGAEFECFDMDFEYCPRCGAKTDEPQESEDKA